MTAQQPDSLSVDGASADSALIAQAMAHANVPIDSAAVAAAAAKADTGRMKPGYRDLSRYSTPGYCMAAIYGMECEIWRHGQRNLLIPGSSDDTLPTAARAIGKRCVAQLDLRHVTPLELPNVMRLAVLLGDTTMLHSVIRQQLALASTTEARGYVWLDAVRELLGHADLPFIHHPAYVAQATGFLPRLDSLGKSVILQRLQAHRLLFDLYQSELFDTTAMNQESRIIASIASVLPDSVQISKPYVSFFSATWFGPIATAYYRQDPRLVSIVKNQLQLANKRYPPEEQRKNQSLIDLMVWQAEKVGTKALPIPGDFWFPANAPHVKPTPGRVTLVVMLNKGNGIMDARSARVRRLYEKYGARGLDIIGLVRTNGYSWSSPPQSPEAEAKVDAWYFLDYLKLPITLVVEQTPFTTQPDGRRVVAGPNRFSAAYPMVHFLLIGRDGRIISTSFGFGSDAELDAYIQKALE
jgi:hypothetical protein